MTRGAVCDAPSALMGARNFADWLWGAIKRQPDLLLCDRPDCAFCSKWKKPTEEHVRKLKGTWKKM